MAIYWRPDQFPMLVKLGRAERQAIVRSALNEHGGKYRSAYGFVLATIVGLGILTFYTGIGRRIADAPLSDWRKWVPLAVVMAVIGAGYLWDVNWRIHHAVKEFLAEKRHAD